MFEKVRFKNFLRSHVLLISANSEGQFMSIDAQTKVELHVNVFQLTLTKIANLGRHETATEELSKS